MQMRGSRSEKCRLVVQRPNLVDAVGAVQSATTRARIGQDQTAVHAPCKNQCEHLPSVVGLSPGFERKSIAPRHEDSTCAPVRQRGQREIAKFPFNDLDLLDVVGACALGATEKFATYLISL